MLLNSTNELLTVEGLAAVRGDWGPPAPPRRGDVVEKQSSAKWVSQSSAEGVGVQGYLRLGSTKGYVEISWYMPWHDVSRMEHAVSVPAALDHRVSFNSEDLDRIVMMVMLLPLGFSRREAPPG
ncbi:hypothetical protein WME79_17115 [Sorangium sp. So ce726]|uniref:hypothetical protein n=1 Tax=Sorangium sp. So ce726 TaxID=3133319 RepID=UPI003F615482